MYTVTFSNEELEEMLIPKNVLLLIRTAIDVSSSQKISSTMV